MLSLEIISMEIIGEEKKYTLENGFSFRAKNVPFKVGEYMDFTGDDPFKASLYESNN